MEIEKLDSIPRMVYVGTLTVNKKPMYIVEVLEEFQGANPQYVTVYEVEKGSNPPIKAYKRERVTRKYKASTELGKLASMMFKPKVTERKVTNPPLFLTDIVEGQDTFTGKFGRGFYEREKDSITISDGSPKVIHGQSTGVFIGLDSIAWNKITIAPDDILLEYEARKALWYM